METLEKIIEIVKECTENRIEIDANTNIVDDGIINSFDRLMILNAIEDEYSIEFVEDDFKDLHVVKDYVDVLENKYLKKSNNAIR